MQRRHGYKVAACIFTAVGAVAGSAQAQTLLGSEIPFDYSRGRNISVAEQARPGYDPVGIALGSFVAFPVATVSLNYDSNVYAVNSGEADDFAVSMTPSVSLNSQWSRHAVNLNGGAQFTRYFNEGLQDRDTWNIGANGRLDLTSEAAINAGGSIADRVEPRTSDNGLADIVTPIQYRQSQAFARATYRTGRTRIVIAADFTSLRFDPVATSTGTVISQSGRDRDTTRATLQLEYALSPSLALFAQGNFTKTAYGDSASIIGVGRDSDSIRGIVGVSMDLAALLRGSFGIGYTKRRYDAAIYQDSGALALEGRLEYFLSERTTATLTARRSIEDGAVVNAGGYTSSFVGLHVDQEIRSNIILSADLSYQNSDYNDRPDHANIWTVGGGVRYLANSWLAVGFNVRHVRRSGEGLATLPYYKQTVAGISLTVQR